VLQLLPLALGSAVYPTLLAVVIVILTQPNPRRLLGAYLAGAMLASLTIGLVIVAGLNSGHVLNGGSGRTINPAVDLVVGLVLLGLLYALLSGRDRRFTERRRQKRAEQAKDGQESWSDRVLRHESVLLTFFVGIALNLPGALYLVALTQIASADQGTVEDVLEILAYNLIMFAWAEIPLVAYGVAPERTEAFIKRVHDWLGTHARQIAIVVCGVAAAYLTIKGVAGLLD
jgi:Sap, sulfolipid-1-addressing protein